MQAQIINMQVNSAGGRGGGQHAARTGQNREQMSARDGIARREGRNEWTRAGGSDGGRQFFLLADSGLPVPASLRSSDIHQVCLSLLLDSRSTEGPFLKIRPLLPLAPLQIKKTHSEGDSSARRPPLGNGCDGRMSAFVDGEERATAVK